MQKKINRSTVLSWGSLQLLLVVILIAGGLILRSLLLFQNIDYDEAYTYLVYVSEGYLTSWATYNLPNNHIFHSIMTVLSTSFLGARPEVLRLFPLLFGVLSLPLFYLVLKKFFSNQVALVAALISWSSFPFIFYSAQSRGYSSQVFFLYLSLYFFLGFSSSLLQGLSAVCMVLAIFSIPTTVFVVGIFGLVFLLQKQPWKKILRWGLCTGILTAVLYLPAVVYSLTLGTKSFAFQGKVTWEMIAERLERIMVFVNPSEWTSLAHIQFVLFILGIVIAMRRSQTRALSLGLLIGLPSLIIAYPSALVFERLWIWILPIFFAFIIASIYELINFEARTTLIKNGMVTITLFFGVFTLNLSRNSARLNNLNFENKTESLFLEMEKKLQPGDFFAASQSLTTELDYWAKSTGKQTLYSRFLIGGDWKYSLYRVAGDKSVLKHHVGKNKFYLFVDQDGDQQRGLEMVQNYLSQDERRPKLELQFEEQAFSTRRASVWLLKE